MAATTPTAWCCARTTHACAGTWTSGRRGEHDRPRDHGGPRPVRASLKALEQEPGSKVVRRHGTTLVINKQYPTWTARQG